MKTLLMVKTGYPLVLRLSAYRLFYRSGWRVAVVDGLINQGLRVADVPIVADLSDTDHVEARVGAVIGRPDAVLTFNDSGLVLAAELAARFGRPFLDPGRAAAAIDKVAQREAFATAGVPSPRFCRCPEAATIRKQLADWGPVVVKPADRAASAGVRLVRSMHEADEAFAGAVAESPTARVLVEEYVDGPEVSVESFAVSGVQRPVGVTDKVTTGGPWFVELGHTVPSTLGGPARQAVLEVAGQACRALDVDFGACHTEVKLTSSGPVVIEVNARVPGDAIVDLVGRALGVDMYRLLLRAAAGEIIRAEDLVPTRAGAAAIRFLPSPGGRLLRASSPALGDPPGWLVDLAVLGERGAPLPPPATDNGARIAYAVAEAPTPATAAYRAGQALSDLHLETTGGEPENAARRPGFRSG